MKVILTCFAGRQHNLEILFEYVDQLLTLNLIDQFHLWDFTKYESDATYMKQKVDSRTGWYELKTVENKQSWSEYYEFYAKAGYRETVIVKCDDDIAFMDVDKFASFTQYTFMNKEFFLVFPSIVNNGVCAFYQQKMGLIPESNSVVFPYDTFNGKLWESGQLCQKLHMFFIENKESWITKTRTLDPIPHVLGDRLSINLFAIHSDNLGLFLAMPSPSLEDEHMLTVVLPVQFQKQCVIYMPFTVSHLAFCQQRVTGLDEPYVLFHYQKLLKGTSGDNITNVIDGPKPTVVVSRFNEDVAWIMEKKDEFDVVVFNKGSSLENCISLPNLGRESHTYVHYIIQNYSKLPELVVFVQASPFDHVMNMNSLVVQAREKGMSQNKAAHNVGRNSVTANFKIFIHNGSQVFPFTVNGKVLGYGEWYTHVTGKPFPVYPIEWYIGGCFAATRERIQSVPLKTWKTIYESLSYSVNPMTGHFMERSWYLLMNSSS